MGLEDPWSVRRLLNCWFTYELLRRLKRSRVVRGGSVRIVSSVKSAVVIYGTRKSPFRSLREQKRCGKQNQRRGKASKERERKKQVEWGLSGSLQEWMPATSRAIRQDLDILRTECKESARHLVNSRSSLDLGPWQLYGKVWNYGLVPLKTFLSPAGKNRQPPRGSKHRC